MNQKEKEYLIAFKLYIENYDPRYRYPKWIKAADRTDAVNKYMAIIKPDLALGACIVMDERPVKQDETVNETKTEHPKNINDVYRKGNLRLLEMMISQLTDLINPTTADHAPRQTIFDMDKINEKLCSTSKLAYLLASGAGPNMLPEDNGCIYTDDFLGNINEYMDTKYIYEFYNDYTLAKIRDDFQRIYDCYSRYGVLPWQDNKEEDAKEMKASVVKGDRRNTTERTPLEILEHEPIFDIEAMGLDKGYAYLLETINDDGSVERKVIVIIDISEKCINYIWRETAHDTIRREGSLSPRPFEEGRYKLYPITAEDLK